MRAGIAQLVGAASLSGRLRLRLFGISPNESSFVSRGFAPAAPDVQTRLEGVGATFIGGYRAALLHENQAVLQAELDRVDLALRGFAYEGAGMGLALSDFFTPWRRRWQGFLEGPGHDHIYMLYVGMGWAWARLPVNITHRLERHDSLLRWLAVDGYGFHQGYFHWRKFIDGQQRPRLTGYALRAFDQGLGRSLWFVKGADVGRIARAVIRFSPARHADLWGGVGLACGYAGGLERAAIETLWDSAGPCAPQLAQGVAFAAKARERAGNPAPHTELACRVVWRRSARDVAKVTDNALKDLPAAGSEAAYEVWRRRIAIAAPDMFQLHLAKELAS